MATAGQPDAARTLLERVLLEYEGSLDCRAALEHLGDLARSEGDEASAERRYRELLMRWPDLNATSGMVEVSLAEILLDRGGHEREHEALRLLKSAMDRRGPLQLDTNLFRWHVALVRAAEAVGDATTAKQAATTALTLAERGPRFTRHRDVGVVRADTKTISWLRERAGLGLET